MPIRGVLTTILIGCAMVAIGWGILVMQNASTVMHEIQALLCLLIVSVCAGVGLVVHAIDEQIVDD